MSEILKRNALNLGGSHVDIHDDADLETSEIASQASSSHERGLSADSKKVAFSKILYRRD